jgi:hypothetical protein
VAVLMFTNSARVGGRSVCEAIATLERSNTTVAASRRLALISRNILPG